MTETQTPPTYSSAQVRRQTGLSFKQLDYWTRKGWLRTTWRSRDGRTVGYGGSGIDRRFSQEELDRATMMARLVALGVAPQQAAKVARNRPLRWYWVGEVIAACEAMQP